MDVLLNPDKFFARKKGMGFRLPIAVVLLYAIISAVSANISLQVLSENLRSIFGKDAELILSFLSFTGSLSAFVGAFLVWILMTAILHVLSAIFGGKGSFSNLMKFTAFSFIPSILLSPIGTYLTIELFRSTTFENLISLTIFSIATNLWIYVYWVFAVKNARELSLKKAAMVSSIPIIIYLAFTIYSMNMQLESIKSLLAIAKT
ncbi:MAG: YIP1 family protein [Archaeoglobaceae archaeon]